MPPGDEIEKTQGNHYTSYAFGYERQRNKGNNHILDVSYDAFMLEDNKLSGASGGGPDYEGKNEDNAVLITIEEDISQEDAIKIIKDSDKRIVKEIKPLDFKGDSEDVEWAVFENENGEEFQGTQHYFDLKDKYHTFRQEITPLLKHLSEAFSKNGSEEEKQFLGNPKSLYKFITHFKDSVNDSDYIEACVNDLPIGKNEKLILQQSLEKIHKEINECQAVELEINAGVTTASALLTRKGVAVGNVGDAVVMAVGKNGKVIVLSDLPEAKGQHTAGLAPGDENSLKCIKEAKFHKWVDICNQLGVSDLEDIQIITASDGIYGKADKDIGKTGKTPQKLVEDYVIGLMKESPETLKEFNKQNFAQQFLELMVKGKEFKEKPDDITVLAANASVVKETGKSVLLRTFDGIGSGGKYSAHIAYESTIETCKQVSQFIEQQVSNLKEKITLIEKVEKLPIDTDKSLLKLVETIDKGICETYTSPKDQKSERLKAFDVISDFVDEEIKKSKTINIDSSEKTYEEQFLYEELYERGNTKLLKAYKEGGGEVKVGLMQKENYYNNFEAPWNKVKRENTSGGVSK